MGVALDVPGSSMTAIASTIPTPFFVLLNAGQRICPIALPVDTETDCNVVYGFADKTPCALLQRSSDQPLTPYPLVQGFLKRKIGQVPVPG